MRGGQVSIEYLIVMGFSIMMLLPLIVFFAAQSDDIRQDLRQTQAQTSIEALGLSAERVYYSGSPAYETVIIQIPESATRFDVLNSTIIMTLSGLGEYDMIYSSQVPLVDATFNPNAGRQSFRIEATIAGVQITEQ